MTTCSKLEWNKTVSNACKAKDQEELKGEMKGKSKLENIMEEGVEAKQYMTLKPLNQVRDLFRMRTCMMKGFKANVKNMYQGEAKCGEGKDSQSDVVPVARLEAFRALKLSRLESIRALKFVGQIGRF